MFPSSFSFLAVLLKFIFKNLLQNIFFFFKKTSYCCLAFSAASPTFLVGEHAMYSPYIFFLTMPCVSFYTVHVCSILCFCWSFLPQLHDLENYFHLFFTLLFNKLDSSAFTSSCPSFFSFLHLRTSIFSINFIPHIFPFC